MVTLQLLLQRSHTIEDPKDLLDFPPALWEEQLLGQLSLRAAPAILTGSTLWVLNLVCVLIAWESDDFRRN